MSARFSTRKADLRKADLKVGLYRFLAGAAVLLASVGLAAQQTGLDPPRILKPLSEDWPSYSGDYTGRRYSALRQVNQSNVKNLTLAWTVRLNAGPTGAGAGGPCMHRARHAPSSAASAPTNMSAAPRSKGRFSPLTMCCM
jgi:hypothetical protein